MEDDFSGPGLDLNTNSTAKRRVRDYYARLPRERKAAGGLELLPWHLLPPVDYLRRDPRNSNDFRDGTFIQPSMVTEAEAVLSTFVKLSITSRGINMRRLDRMVAICLVLQIINAPQVLGRFLEQRISDASLPLSKATVIGIFRDGDAALDFLGEQYRAKPRQIKPQEHIDFEVAEPLPYLVQRNIGTGGYGKVDQVEDTSTGKVYAMKSWRSVDQNAKTRLLEEASILKRLTNYKHVVRLINTYARDKLLGLVMDPVATCDLNDLIEARPRDRAWAIPILTRAPGCLAATLSYIHALKIRHKDISPRNILLCQDNILLTDFGLSIDVSEMSRTDTSGPTARTLNYCSPEVASQQSRGRKSDVFSLGCVILVILSLLRQNGVEWLEDVLSFRPFHQNLERIQKWIQISASASHNESTNAWLRNCSRMIREDADTRPTMQEILEDVLSDPSLEESFLSLFCSECLEAKDTSEMAAIRDQRKVSVEDSGIGEVVDSTAPKASADEMVTDDTLLAHPDITSYQKFFRDFHYSSATKYSFDGTAESLTNFIGFCIFQRFIPGFGIHPQVMNANFRLFLVNMIKITKDFMSFDGSRKRIQGFRIICRDAHLALAVKDAFEDTAKWYFENGRKFDRYYTQSETYQKRKNHGPGPIPMLRSELEWLASTMKDWQDRLVEDLHREVENKHHEVGNIHHGIRPLEYTQHEEALCEYSSYSQRPVERSVDDYVPWEQRAQTIDHWNLIRRPLQLENSWRKETPPMVNETRDF